jgi:hypothetical protein
MPVMFQFIHHQNFILSILCLLSFTINMFQFHSLFSFFLPSSSKFSSSLETYSQKGRQENYDHSATAEFRDFSKPMQLEMHFGSALPLRDVSFSVMRDVV